MYGIRDNIRHKKHADILFNEEWPQGMLEAYTAYQNCKNEYPEIIQGRLAMQDLDREEQASNQIYEYYNSYYDDDFAMQEDGLSECENQFPYISYAEEVHNQAGISFENELNNKMDYEATYATMRTREELVNDADLDSIQTPYSYGKFHLTLPQYRAYGTLQDLCKHQIARHAHLYEHVFLKHMSEVLDADTWYTILKLALKYHKTSMALISVWCNIQDDKQNCINLEGLDIPNRMVKHIFSLDIVITELNLSGCNLLPSSTLEVIPICFPFIKVLKLRKTNITDNTVLGIGVRCVRLEYLDIQETAVSEKTLLSVVRNGKYLKCLLGVPFISPSIMEQFFASRKEGVLQLGSHTKDLVMGLTSAPVIDSNVVDLVLTPMCCNLTVLHVLNFDRIVPVYYGSTTPVNIRILLSTITTLQDIKLESSFVVEDDLYSSLKNQKNLHSLHLKGVQPPGASMEEFFLSFKDCPLVNLSLEYIDDLAAKAMVENCKRIKSFKLGYGSPETQIALTSPTFLHSLSTLELRFDLGEELQLAILRNCKLLEKVCFVGVPAPFLYHIATRNLLLSRFAVTDCEALNDKIMYQVASNCPHLKKVRIQNCPITEFALFTLGMYCKSLCKIIHNVAFVTPIGYVIDFLQTQCPGVKLRKVAY